MENNQQGSGYGHDHDHDHDLDTAQEVSNAAFASADHQPTPSPVPTPGISEAPSNSYFEGLRPPTTEQTRTRSRSPGRSIFRSRSRTERPQPRSRETLGQPSIRIRRSQNSFSSARQNPLDRTITADPAATGSYPKHDNRPRSISQPERGGSAYGPAAKIPGRKPGAKPLEDLPRVTEEGRRPTLAELDVGPDATNSEAEQAEIPTRHRGRTWWGRRQREPPRPLTEQERADLDAQQAEAEYHERLVDWLDTVDPEVQTLSTLTNVQNSLFVPDLGSWVNRRPAYSLTRHDPRRARISAPPAPPSDLETAPLPAPSRDDVPPMMRSSTITSNLTESHYAALPHGTNLDGWTSEEKSELDDHVRHMLHSRRARMMRRLKGFGQYVRRPLGFLVTLYATLITLFGLAWVLFLIGWVYVGDEQVYAVHIIDSVLVALFAVMGDGLAPFRAVDTYHMIYIWRYTHILKNGVKPRAKLQKKNIPPEIRASMDLSRQSGLLAQSESQEGTTAFPSLDEKPSDVENNSPLTPKQQLSMQHHQRKLAKSHSFYKPNETFTHTAFPLGYLVAIVILLDCHSCLQISLGATTWGIDYHTRPFAITTVILCVSITCNITAGLVISMGDRKSRKKDVVALLDRQELTGDAIRQMQRKRSKELKEGTEDTHMETMTEEGELPELRVNIDPVEGEETFKSPILSELKVNQGPGASPVGSELKVNETENETENEKDKGKGVLMKENKEGSKRALTKSPT